MKTWPDRFWNKIVKLKNGCWLWKGNIHPSGYGVAYVPKENSGIAYKGWKSHIVAYELTKGEKPNHLDLDHLCRIRHCVNPDHLEPVTRQINLLRGKGPTAINAAKTHCDRGHEFIPENTYIRPNGCRNCRRCKQIDDREYWNKRFRNGIPFTKPTHCKNNHEYNDKNTYIRKEGYRRCRICKNNSAKKRRKNNLHGVGGPEFDQS